MPKAKRVLREKSVDDYGAVIEINIWQVPQPVPASSHYFKYRIVYIVDEERVIGFDNERGKGDHKHINGLQYPYVFTDAENLLRDFYDEIKKWRRLCKR